MTIDVHEERLIGNRTMRTYDGKKIVQALADGKRIAEIADGADRKYHGLQDFIKRLRRRHGLRTTYQLVAHYVRNGWVD